MIETMRDAGSAARRRATYEDLLGLSPHVIGEILDGELHATPRPSARHGRAASRLGGALDGPFDRGRGGPGGWIILDEPELHLGADVVVPDLAGWRRARLPELPDAAAFTLAPDWACEVLSPSTAAIDRAVKLPIYAREGVGHVWLSDPQAQTLEVLALDRGGWRLVAVHRGAAEVPAEPFAAVPLDLGALWER